MSYLFSAIVGIVQGLAEFLPISSSGHIIVAEKVLSLLDMKAAPTPGLLRHAAHGHPACGRGDFLEGLD